MSITAGIKGAYSIPGFGEKFIGVESGGTLEIHGREKLAWTKITKTITKPVAASFLMQKEVNWLNYLDNIKPVTASYIERKEVKTDSILQDHISKPLAARKKWWDCKPTIYIKGNRSYSVIVLTEM